jgi:hypothetical protein
MTMARTKGTGAATRLARVRERIDEARRARAGNQGPVIAYEDDDEEAVVQYVAKREPMGAHLVVVVLSLAPRPPKGAPPWR